MLALDQQAGCGVAAVRVMTVPPKKQAIVIPAAEQVPAKGPVPFVFAAGERGRDVTKPIGYDARGRPLNASRGLLIQWEPRS